MEKTRINDPSAGQADTILASARGDGAKRILLINMPFAGIDRPALGISLLQAALVRESFPADIAYFNILFREMIGERAYALPDNHKAAHSAKRTAGTLLAGDWIFSQYFYGFGNLDADGYVQNVLRHPGSPISETNISRLLRLRATVPPFIDACMERVKWDDYWLVGFTTTFEQNMASLCLARVIRERRPAIKIAFGGANCAGVMGAELLRQYSFIDYIAIGEADQSFPALIRALESGRGPFGIAGLAWRDGNDCQNNGPAEVVQPLDNLPYPNFDDYFAQLYSSPLSRTVKPWLPLETSRGCWWGEINPCTFCGLNGSQISFRAKNPKRAFAEILFLWKRYKISSVGFVDNVLNLTYFKTLIPTIIRRIPELSLFWETRSCLTKPQVRLLGMAGVRTIQPGIESLSSPILDLMRKGVGALQNIAFLKWCHQYGISAPWLLLYGFPGEDPSEYSTVLNALASMTHLPPPYAIRPIHLDRFSPNFHESGMRGFANVRPLAAYRYIYPFPGDVLSRIGCYFDFDYPDGRQPDDYMRPICEFWCAWRQQKSGGTLEHQRLPDGAALIKDTRFNRLVARIRLSAPQNAVYEFCDQPRSFTAIQTFLKRRFGGLARYEVEMRKFLDRLVDARMMAREGERYLGLAPIEDLPAA